MQDKDYVVTSTSIAQCSHLTLRCWGQMGLDLNVELSLTAL